MTDNKPYSFSVSEIRAGKENDGQLESTDIFLTTDDFSLLVNTTVDGCVTYSFIGRIGDDFSGTIRKANDLR